VEIVSSFGGDPPNRKVLDDINVFIRTTIATMNMTTARMVRAGCFVKCAPSGREVLCCYATLSRNCLFLNYALRVTERAQKPFGLLAWWPLMALAADRSKPPEPKVARLGRIRLATVVEWQSSA